MTKALLGIRTLLDDRIGSLRSKEDVDQDADLARRLQAELEQEDARRQVRRPGQGVSETFCSVLFSGKHHC